MALVESSQSWAHAASDDVLVLFRLGFVESGNFEAGQ